MLAENNNSMLLHTSEMKCAWNVLYVERGKDNKAKKALTFFNFH